MDILEQVLGKLNVTVGRHDRRVEYKGVARQAGNWIRASLNQLDSEALVLASVILGMALMVASMAEALFGTA